MVRSTAISLKLGLAVAASALQLWPLPARAQDAPDEKAEARPQPVETKPVRIMLLPPATDPNFKAWRPAPVDGAPILMVKPAETAPVVPPQPAPAEAAPASGPPAENAAIAQPRSAPVET